MYLFFDTETTGLPKDYGAPIEEVDNWPRAVQLAWALYDHDRYLVRSQSVIIRQENPIPEEATKIHGITNDMTKIHGTHRNLALNGFRDMSLLINTKYLIAHNIAFDRKIIGAEYLRDKRGIPFERLQQVCTMKSSTKYCALPGVRGGFKWPKLEELHLKLFDEGIEGAHNAMIDVFATARCFFRLKELGVIET